MHKGYIQRWEQDRPHLQDIFHFCPLAEHAAYWPSRYNAEAKCAELSKGVKIGRFLCTDFQIEEAAPDRFLIFCEAPFEEFVAAGV